MICSNCLTNEGLRIEAEKLGLKVNSVCQNCNSKTGLKLTEKGIKRLYFNFFEHGTRGIGIYEPSTYKVVDKKYAQHVVLDNSLIQDIEILGQYAEFDLMYNAPPTWQVGDTDIEEDLGKALDENKDKVHDIVDDLIDRCGVIELKTGEKIYRVRINPDTASASKSYDSPSINKIKAMRFNLENVPIFYGAFDIETCIHECRATVYDEIVLATFQTKQDLCIVDLEQVKDEDAESPWESKKVFIENNLNVNNYKYCQILGKMIRERKFDGIKYRSFYSNVREGNHYNILLFGHPLKESKLELLSLNRIKLDKISYEYTFGPLHDYEILFANPLRKFVKQCHDFLHELGEDEEAANLVKKTIIKAEQLLKKGGYDKK